MMTARKPNDTSNPTHKARRPKAAFKERRTNRDGLEIIQIYGLHAVAGALNNEKRTITKLMATENVRRRLANAIGKRTVTVETTTPKALDKLLGSDTVHQGIVLETLALPTPSLEDLAEAAHSGGPIIILDQVTDPHNVGAILRSSAVFGASGLIMTRRHSPALSGALAKAASGALELVPVHLAANLARTLKSLAEHGLNIVGLDGTADVALEDLDFSQPGAIVLGAEGKGLRQLTIESCTKLARIEAPGSLTSLNVSNAAAVALHQAASRRTTR